MFHVDVPGCLVPREVIRRIHTIIPKESFLFHVKVSVMNCAVRPLLFERLMNVCSMDCQDYLFVFHHVSFMFDRFLLAFHHLPLICAMRFTCFDNVHSCFQLFWYVIIIFHWFVLVLIFFLIVYWHLCGFELNVTSCSLIFQLFFLLRWKWGIQYAHLWSPPQLLTWTMAGKIFFP